ncbi:MAG: hypothetical protein UX87_C0007G0037 [Candidatus Amesbacteria bacterium GW2011_GWA1_47_16]|uniref:DNA-3-methyladenine glycosylase II n=3 Tax=Candidatus Amesiibacteriota TaxID=1752730 RepID=A0A1F4ZTX8_9BACT|nr:MAG: hypothetical protein UX87_C0007G0037 [Candidatus Amesbacteria bacterium GW2011_GWA1_47_16]KKU98073.1 MAG: hypothetical protein UY28_C0008G0019 [Candidatus Amesbacteria bacterium GW2011_GWB1_48_13]OGD08814.1 MAG: hypothetical protein A2395_01775 [Candidatus Amesbacteria bacterium RIFOXYB1_FULL_47_9]
MNIDQALKQLKKDQVLAGLIEKYGPLSYERDMDYFSAVVETIVSQQLSGKAAATIFSRLKKLFHSEILEPKSIIDTPVERLRSAGLSGSKSLYIKDFSRKVLDGTLNLSGLDEMDDEEVITHLVQVKGIGRWSAEMILMFSLHRPDILPLDDLGIRNAFIRLYKIGITKGDKIITRMQKIADAWRPHRTIACWYLWKSLE